MVSTSTFTLITLTLLTTLVSAIPCPGAAPCPKDFRVHPNGNTNYCLTVADLTAKGTPATVYVPPCPNSRSLPARNATTRQDRVGTGNFPTTANMSTCVTLLARPTTSVSLPKPVSWFLRVESLSLTFPHPLSSMSPDFHWLTHTGKGASLTLGNQVSLAECFNDGSHTWYPIAESGTIVALALLNDNGTSMGSFFLHTLTARHVYGASRWPTRWRGRRGVDLQFEEY
jgi:hypothetical protein